MEFAGAHNLETVYQKYKNQIYTLCLHLCRDRNRAEELYSDTWARAAEKFEQLKPELNALNWIYTICLNIYRKKRLKNSILSFFSEINEPLVITENDLRADEKMEKSETQTLLHRNIAQLPDIYRIPIILFYFRELSYAEIAQTMQIPLGRVKFRLNKAKEILYKKMKNYE